MHKPENPKPETPRIVQRRDATGHLDPHYERELLEHAREMQSENQEGRAFLTRPRAGEPVSEELGESYVESATRGEPVELERRDSVVPEEQGGPFVPTTAQDEFAPGTDASNIAEATREPLPKTSKADP